MASSSTSKSSLSEKQSSSSAARSSGVGNYHSIRSKVHNSHSRRSVTPTSKTSSSSSSPSPSVNDHDGARVRVAVRVRPKSPEDDLHLDADFPDCVELQPELKRLKLRKNNWSSESYKFDEVFVESASQKRVYEVVAKPVVESFLNGYNGTIMAYGQTSTGKTYTVSRVGKDDPSERGIMVRALEDILANASRTFDTVEVSYLQLYLECIQDLLAPEKNNIPIVEDPKTGEVSLPGVAVVKLQDFDHCLQILQIGEANRHAANTNMNTESSRSHAILMVYARKSLPGKTENEAFASTRDKKTEMLLNNGGPKVLKSKLLLVDLAGSERIDKSGSEGRSLEEARSINLSLTSLGKCINAVAENSPHIPARDSKLTRLLRDSFGGSARTSLIVTISQSARNYAETASTILFGQRVGAYRNFVPFTFVCASFNCIEHAFSLAMTMVNTVKLKEEFDYESLCRKLEQQVDYLTAETERQKKQREDDKEKMERKINECQNSFIEAERNLAARSEFLKKENNRLEAEIKDLLNELNLQKDRNTSMSDEVARLEMSLNQNRRNDLEKYSYQRMLADTTQMYEKKITELMVQLEDEQARFRSVQEQLAKMKILLSNCQASSIQGQKDNGELGMKIQEMHMLHEKTICELQSLRIENEELTSEKIGDEKRIGELEMRLKELHQLHEETVREFQSLKTVNESFFSEKIQDQKEIDDLKMKLEEISERQENAIKKFQSIESENEDLLLEKEKLNEELCMMQQKASAEEKQRRYVEDECAKLKRRVLDSGDGFEDKISYTKKNVSEVPSAFEYAMCLPKAHQPRETLSMLTQICLNGLSVGLQKIIAMLSSENLEVQIHAVKVVANLAAEDSNQECIIEEGGLQALLMLLESSRNATIHRVASGAIANLAMNEMNQILIVSKGGAKLLATIASKTDDPQTLRMVAGAIANLCGNPFTCTSCLLAEKLHAMLKEDGGVRALLGMARSGNNDVMSQVARGLANFAKCESRATIQGYRKGRSLLIEDGALSWLVANSVLPSTSTQRHIDLALCHLAQNGDNAEDIISSGALKELIRISCESSKEDVRSLAKKTIRSIPSFQAAIQTL
ncbi:hypothetical protein Scep_005161 [Stephania cephalantha]|uniref:Kinesin motor domain-containing protein n=1 Tax=Stephania cephalantha TaxID=152367 RepID=A0AAP0PW37_9MAGN